MPGSVSIEITYRSPELRGAFSSVGLSYSSDGAVLVLSVGNDGTFTYYILGSVSKLGLSMDMGPSSVGWRDKLVNRRH